MAGSKKQVFYIHGGNAYSRYEDYLENLRTKEIRDLPFLESMSIWSRSLADDLGDAHEVFTPSMPNKQNAKYEEWKIWFERHFEYLKDGVTLVGWSLGGYFLIKYLIDTDPPFKIKNLFLLASPAEADDLNGEDGGDFSFNPQSLPVIAEKVENIVIMHSVDDFVVPFAHAEKLARALPEAEFITFADKNHFLIEEFPELIDKIKALG